MRKNKMFFIFILFMLIFNINKYVYADEIIEETDISTEEIEEILEATVEVNEEPDINSRYAVILDRTSRQDLIWKI